MEKRQLIMFWIIESYNLFLQREFFFLLDTKTQFKPHIHRPADIEGNSEAMIKLSLAEMSPDGYLWIDQKATSPEAIFLWHDFKAWLKWKTTWGCFRSLLSGPLMFGIVIVPLWHTSNNNVIGNQKKIRLDSFCIVVIGGLCGSFMNSKDCHAHQTFRMFVRRSIRRFSFPYAVTSPNVCPSVYCAILLSAFEHYFGCR